MTNGSIISINQLVYGQPTIEQKMMMANGTAFSKHTKVFMNEPYPKMIREMPSRRFMT